jgi:hypothetical protein
MSKVKLTVQRNLGTKSGTNKAGKAWEQVGLLCKTIGEYPKDLVLLVTGGNDVKTAKTLNGGETIETTLQPESREFNGKWYTDIKIWGLEVMKSQAPQAVDDSIDPELGF